MKRYRVDWITCQVTSNHYLEQRSILRIVEVRRRYLTGDGVEQLAIQQHRAQQCVFSLIAEKFAIFAHAVALIEDQLKPTA